MMSFKNFLRKKNSKISLKNHPDNFAWIIIVIAFYVILKILIYTSGKVFFDEGVYAGMARFFATGGRAGYFEYIRPLLLPFLLSPLQYLQIDPLITGRILGLMLTIGAILIIYAISRTHFGKDAAKYSMLLFAASSSVIFFGGTILTDVLVFAIALAAASFAWREKWFIAGCILGVAFLLKFPVIILGVPIFFLLIIRHRMKFIKPAIYFCLGIIIFAAPYLIFNAVYYAGPIIERITRPLIDASLILQNETWIYEKASLWKYGLFLILLELPIVVSFILGWVKSRQKEKMLFLFFTLCATAFMLYFSCYVARLDYRYMLSVIPFLAVLGGKGIERSVNKSWKAIIPIAAIALIFVIIMLSLGIAKTTAHISTSNDIVFTNAGQVLLKTNGKTLLYPGPNMGYLYQQWYINSSAEWLILDLEGYPCQKQDEHCKNNMHLQISRLLTANNLAECGQLYGEDVIILAKHPESTIGREDCIRKIRGGPYSFIDSHVYLRLHAAVITKEGRLQNIEQTQKIVFELTKQNISGVYVLVASNISLDNTSQEFIKSLPRNIELGVLPSDNVETEKFIAEIYQSTGKNISVIASQSDDWIGKHQVFPPGIQYCVGGSWDQTIMSIPCHKIDLYTMHDWNDLSLEEPKYLYSSYDALSKTDYEVGIDIPVAALQNENNTNEIVEFIRYISEGLNNGQD
jgi:hypothetical protein